MGAFTSSRVVVAIFEQFAYSIYESIGRWVWTKRIGQDVETTSTGDYTASMPWRIGQENLAISEDDRKIVVIVQNSSKKASTHAKSNIFDCR